MNLLNLFRGKVKPKDAVLGIAQCVIEWMRHTYELEARPVDGAFRFRMVRLPDTEELPDVDGDGIPG